MVSACGASGQWQHALAVVERMRTLSIESATGRSGPNGNSWRRQVLGHRLERTGENGSKLVMVLGAAEFEGNARFKLVSMQVKSDLGSRRVQEKHSK